MVLYSADISNIAKPVKSVKATKEPVEKVQEKPKRVRKRKAVVEEVVEEVKEEVKEEKLTVPKKKKNVTKKAKAPVQDDTPEHIPVEAPVVVEEQKPKKKKVKKEPVVEEKLSPEKEQVIPEEKLPPKKKRAFRDPSVPPLWFEKYIQAVKKEEALVKQEKVPAKVVKKEATDVAQKSWEDGLTRDRVSNEVDNHMNRMYSMIFSRR